MSAENKKSATVNGTDTLTIERVGLSTIIIFERPKINKVTIKIDNDFQSPGKEVLITTEKLNEDPKTPSADPKKPRTVTHVGAKTQASDLLVAKVNEALISSETLQDQNPQGLLIEALVVASPIMQSPTRTNGINEHAPLIPLCAVGEQSTPSRPCKGR